METPIPVEGHDEVEVIQAAADNDQAALHDKENEATIESNDQNNQSNDDDEIKVSKEQIMRMMSEINQLKQMQFKKEQASAIEFIKEKEVIETVRNNQK